MLHTDAGANTPAVLRCFFESVLGPTSLPVRISSGTLSAAYQANVSGQDVIIKLTTGRNSYLAEIFFYNQLGSMGGPVPTVIFYSACIEELKCPCLVITRIDGVPLVEATFTQEQLNLVYAELGDIFAKIHTIPCKSKKFGFGSFLPEVQSEFPDWKSFLNNLHDCQKTPIILHGLGLIDSNQMRHLVSAIEECLTHTFSPVLLHGDLGPDHIFVRSGKIIGVIDPGNAFLGPVEYDLAYSHLYMGEEALRNILMNYH